MKDVKDCSCKTEDIPEHICPYKSEINDDHDTKCKCCESCKQECCDDI